MPTPTAAKKRAQAAAADLAKQAAMEAAAEAAALLAKPNDLGPITNNLERLNRKEHDKAQIDTIKSFIEAKLAQAAPATQPPLLPRWAAVTSAVAAGLVAVFGVGSFGYAMLNGYAGSRAAEVAMTAKITTLEQALAAGTTSITTLSQRVQQLESRFDTATTINTQWRQGMVDRVRALETSDQQSLERVAALTNTIAGILPRLEEILRRQERLENRLGQPGAARPLTEPDVDTGWQKMRQKSAALRLH